MTKKGAVFKWTKECDAAFKLLKEKLMEEPVLINPQVNKDYVIHCDASKYSYSGILQQTRPGTDELAPVAYFSGNFNKTQVKWNKLQRMKLMLSTSQPGDFHSTLLELKLQSLVTTSHSRISLKVE